MNINTTEDLDNAIAYWHMHDTGNSIVEFLGVTKEQYFHWVMQVDDELFLKQIKENKHD